MSMFCGIYNLDEKPIDRKKFDHITSKLALWDPDNKYEWVRKDLAVSIWQRYYTPESLYAKFPTVNNYNHFLVASNTRLDNRKELAEKLAVDPAAAKIMSDEAFILRAYEKWQEDCSKYLLGDFVFAIWDDNKKHLFISRDQIGHAKAIYYYHLPNKLFVFGSNIRPVYEHPDVPIELNERQLAYCLVYALPHKTEAFYKNIYRLPVGHSIVITKNNFRLIKYWNGVEKKKIRYSNNQDYIDHFNEIFEEAVNCRLRSNTDIGSHLSGGLDSSSVTAVAAKILQTKNQKVYAYGAVPLPGLKIKMPANSIADESEYMEAVANYYPNIELAKVVDDSSSVFEGIDKYHDYAERPFTSSYNRLWMEKILELCVKKNIRSLLCGMYGNLSISWQGPHYHLGLSRIFEKIKPCLRPTKILLEKFLKNKSPWPEYRFINPVFAREQKMLWRYLKNTSPMSVPPRYSSIVDLASMNSSEEACFGAVSRDPTSDLRILTFCQNIPMSQYRNGQSSKLLVRKGMEGVLPSSVLEREIRGYQVADSCFRIKKEFEGVFGLVKNMLLSQNGEGGTCEYYDLPRIYKEVSKWQLEGDGVFINDNPVMLVLLTNAFIQNKFK